MRFLTPIAIAATLAATLTACSAGPDCTPGEPGPAATSVAAKQGHDELGVTVAVLDWKAEPHPQVPGEGDKVHFRYRVTADPAKFPPDHLSLQACAVDAGSIVLGCTEIGLFPQDASAGEGDDWIGVPTAYRVVLVPDQMYAGPAGCNESDPKDGYGYQPPRYLRPGDKVT
ncbi:hypothetical protein Afil01_26660 [Actinorhabdospora filicis]|uniref:Lipoprotein n=1 Tax=Actinorhabdospora filicis TaxID=1785913 RepID=A0A9W6SLD9_9ACTN|nr:hypothetical protein [Actinorhabdospora filicis]GLZ77859.1 hypothetical protein Afil01_26660 [Actinorhabdospora filicis]